MLRTRSLGRSLALLSMHSCVSACGASSEESQPDPQATCGRSVDLQEVELYDGRAGVPRAFVNRHRLAVGLLRWREDLALRYREEAGNVSGLGWCTGTLVADDLFLTAGHCLSPDDTKRFTLPREKEGIPLRPSELAREFVVEFRYQVSGQTGLSSMGQTFEVVRLEEYRSNDLDYAILRLSGSAGLGNGVARVSAQNVEAGSLVALLQHPAGATMKIGAGAIASVQGSRISYDSIDTLGGSSGAAILDARTGKLVGIHTNGGCTADAGGANYGVTIEALTAASPALLQPLMDSSKDFVVGDWDNDHIADLGVFHDGCVYPDADHDGSADRERRQCAPDSGADEYFVGRWEAGMGSRLGWRRRGCVFLDTNPQRPLCYGNERDRFELLVADWNGDGRSDLGIQRGKCIDFDTDLDGVPDALDYCFGDGLAEDQYLVGDWDGSHADRIAVRRGNTILIDVDRDGVPDPDKTRIYGAGGNEAQYLTGDWNGDGRAKLAVRRRSVGLMTHDAGDGAREDRVAEEIRVYRDFWSAP